MGRWGYGWLLRQGPAKGQAAMGPYQGSEAMQVGVDGVDELCVRAAALAVKRGVGLLLRRMAACAKGSMLPAPHTPHAHFRASPGCPHPQAQPPGCS